MTWNIRNRAQIGCKILRLIQRANKPPDETKAAPSLPYTSLPYTSLPSTSLPSTSLRYTTPMVTPKSTGGA